MKICTKCGGEPKPVAEFSKKAAASDGLQGQCKACEKVAKAKYYAENSDKRRAYDAKWQAANPEKKLACNAEYRADNREKVKVEVAAWKAVNPEALRIYKHTRRARKLANGGTLSKGLSAKLFKLQRGKCACGCEQPLDNNVHLDHWMPLALGGANEDHNIRLLLPKCNMSKGAKHPRDYMRQQGFSL